MQIIDLNEKFQDSYYHCLEEWSDEMKEAGNHKKIWFSKIKDKGLRVKIAVDEDKACGMIQYIPSELSDIKADNFYFIKCIWVHGHKQGVGNCQKRGIGAALLDAAEQDAKALGAKAMAAWGIAMPFWMKASWFKKHGYKKSDKNGVAVLLWKPFDKDAQPPRWIRQKKQPTLTPGKVTVVSFINGWCPAQNIVHERAKRAAHSFGDAVEFRGIHTFDQDVFKEWGISDALFIDSKQVNTGPPPSFKKLQKKIGRRVKKIRKAESLNIIKN
jgi:GNAT superfamily N-acetyltransferase